MIRTRYLESLARFASQEDIAGGIEFYPGCRVRIEELAFEYGFHLAPAVGAFAALSPNSHLAGNFRSLASCLRSVRDGIPEDRTRVASYNRGRRAAFRILSGEEEFADVCSGPKITAFRHNLLFPNTSERVTVDGHLICAMTGEDMDVRAANLHWRTAVKGSDEVRYQHFERAFRRWARRVSTGWSVPTYQAVIWNAHRRRKGLAAISLPDVIEPYGVAA